MRRVARRAKTISPRATIQLTTIELVIGNPLTRPISTAFCENACSTVSDVVSGFTCSGAFVDVAGTVWGWAATMNDAEAMMNSSKATAKIVAGLKGSRSRDGPTTVIAPV